MKYTVEFYDYKNMGELLMTLPIETTATTIKGILKNIPFVTGVYYSIKRNSDDMYYNFALEKWVKK